MGRCLVVAELSANHNQHYERAERLVKAAAESGADAVKLQAYRADTLTIECDKEYFKIGGGTIWEGRTLYDLYEEAYTPWEWHEPLKKEAEALGMQFFSTPFDRTAVDFLEKLDVPLYKVASFELVDHGLLEFIGRIGKPVIMSTGMATQLEIEEAMGVLRRSGAAEITLLKCTSAYPAVPEEMNLRTIPHMAEAFGCRVGLSDHTMGIAVPVAAVALGACVIEKHLTLDRSIPGPDSAFSLEPLEFKAMVDAVRIAEKALGRVRYEPTEQEQASRVFRRSLFVVEDVKAGDVFTEKNLRSIRPGHGLPPKYYDIIIGKRATKDIARGTPVSWEHVLKEG